MVDRLEMGLGGLKELVVTYSFKKYKERNPPNHPIAPSLKGYKFRMGGIHWLVWAGLVHLDGLSSGTHYRMRLGVP